MATRDNENKQHNDASLEPRKKEQVKQTNKQTNDRRKNMTNPKSVEGQKEIIRRTRAEMSKTDFKKGDSENQWTDFFVEIKHTEKPLAKMPKRKRELY